eukprot:114078-Pelagomonas_calceolata.AAC.3
MHPLDINKPGCMLYRHACPINQQAWLHALQTCMPQKSTNPVACSTDMHALDINKPGCMKAKPCTKLLSVRVSA